MVFGSQVTGPEPEFTTPILDHTCSYTGRGGSNGVNHISMYLGYHNIEIKTRDILKLNFGIWNIAGSKPDSVLK